MSIRTKLRINMMGGAAVAAHMIGVEVSFHMDSILGLIPVVTVP